MTVGRVLFVGLDAADIDLIEPWAAAGELPTLQGLLETSIRVDTEGPPGFYVGAIWPTLYTAVNPAEHGVHNWKQIRLGTYDFEPAPSRPRLAHAAFWDVASAAGRRVAVVDAPLAAESPGLNGLQVLEWGDHDSELGFATTPPDLADQIAHRFGLHPVQGNCNQHDRSPREVAAFRDALVDGAGAKAELSRDLLERDDWDLFVTVFSESHCVGHQLWHVHDPNHPKHDPEVATAVGDPVLDVYRAVDAGLGRLLAAADDDTTVAVFASHGMGAHHDPTFLLDAMLERLEIADNLRAPGRRLRWLARLGPLGRTAWARRRAALDARIDELVGPLEPWNRLWFQHPNNEVEAGIRLNVVGREPFGRVEPGAHYEGVCERLIGHLHALTDGDTGEPLVRDVLVTRREYGGRHLDEFPDLVVRWNRPARPVHRIVSPAAGEVVGDYAGARTGDHHPRGALLLRGPGLAPGRAATHGPVPVIDLGPTILALLGVDWPGVEGRPVPV
jgi:predicted AlkP superfamily phosphohydrolase/phosphomutase